MEVLHEVLLLAHLVLVNRLKINSSLIVIELFLVLKANRLSLSRLKRLYSVLIESHLFHDSFLRIPLLFGALYIVLLQEWQLLDNVTLLGLALGIVPLLWLVAANRFLDPWFLYLG